MGGSQIGTADPGLVSPAPTILYVLPPCTLLLAVSHSEHKALLPELALCRNPGCSIPGYDFAHFGKRGNRSEIRLSVALVAS